MSWICGFERQAREYGVNPDTLLKVADDLDISDIKSRRPVAAIAELILRKLKEKKPEEEKKDFDPGLKGLTLPDVPNPSPYGAGLPPNV